MSGGFKHFKSDRILQFFKTMTQKKKKVNPRGDITRNMKIDTPNNVNFRLTSKFLSIVFLESNN
jgi:hypothetical protein